MYYRRANAAMIVYDITRDKSFQEAQEWVKGNHSNIQLTSSGCWWSSFPRLISAVN